MGISGPRAHRFERRHLWGEVWVVGVVGVMEASVHVEVPEKDGKQKEERMPK